jgi:hypothetical protein
MKTVNIIIAPREPIPCAFVGGRLTLLDAPSNPGFKVWVEGDTTLWEHGDSREHAEKRMKQRLKAEKLKLGEIIQQEKSEM